MLDLWDLTHSITNGKRLSDFHKAIRLVQGLLQTPVKDQYLFNKLKIIFLLVIIILFHFEDQDLYLKFKFLQNEDQRTVGTTFWYKDVLASTSFKRKVSLAGTTCVLQGCSLGLVEGIQRLELLIWLTLFAVEGATGQKSLACFKIPDKTISEYLILHLLICDV